MKWTKMEKLIDNEEAHAKKLAKKEFGNINDKKHSYVSFINYPEHTISIHLTVSDPHPARKGFNYWMVMGVIEIDDNGNKSYSLRFPYYEHQSGIKKLYSPQNLEGMIHEMAAYHKEFMKIGYPNLKKRKVQPLP